MEDTFSCIDFNEHEISPKLLSWYHIHHRSFPWRVSPEERKTGIIPDPYRIWLSEIMSQQTTTTAIIPYFIKFLNLWPDIGALANAHPEDIMKAWSGLGYYSRARNLSACSRLIISKYSGRFPKDEKTLRTLPGIGLYTAGAIAAIAFNNPAPALDGNTLRVISRLFALETPLPALRKEAAPIAEKLLPHEQSGDFAQSIMDLGAMICLPRKPRCSICPLCNNCKANFQKNPAEFPYRQKKKPKPLRHGAVFIVQRSRDKAILLRKRPESGLLAGMTEPPGTFWNSHTNGETGVENAPFPASWHECGHIYHVFTHFSLNLMVYFTKTNDESKISSEYFWSSDPWSEALPTVMRKSISLALLQNTKNSPE